MTEFYEDDEPVEKIRAAFDAGERGVTAQPRFGWTFTLTFGPDGPRLTEV